MIRLFAIPLVTLSALSAALLISTPLLVGAVDAQEKAPGFQYRFRSAPIPAATPDEPKAAAFSSDAAKEYLDAGAMLWANQKQCVACHTHGIYMLARPALTPSWGEPPEDSRAFVAAQAEKIRQSGVQTGSSPVQMAYTARGLATWDSQLHGSTSPETDAALRYLFEMQGEDGSIRVKDRWPPLDSSTYHGTAMAAMAVAEAPGWRSTLDDAELVAKIDRLESYLRETPTENDHQGVLLLWASTRLPDLLTPSRRRELERMIWSHQQTDGGWSIRTFLAPRTLVGRKRAERLGPESDNGNPPSDGYQTGLAVVVLRDAGVPADDPRLKRAVRWLLANQRQSGRWWTRSLNRESRFHFISYSGTAYAAWALAKCDALATDVQRRE